MTKQITDNLELILHDDDPTQPVQPDFESNFIAINAADKQRQTDLTTHVADTTAVHGITDTSLLETQAGAQTKANTAANNAQIAATGAAAALAFVFGA